MVAQTAIIRKIELAGEKIIVHYDLDDNNPNNEYQINLFASKDKFSAPLKMQIFLFCFFQNLEVPIDPLENFYE